MAYDNFDQVILPSAARTTTAQGTSSDIPVNGRNLTVVLDTTVIGSGNVTLTINGKDQASGKYYLLLAGAAVSTNTTNRYRISPHLTAAANAIAQDILPATVQIVVTHNNANPATYSVGIATGN